MSADPVLVTIPDVTDRGGVGPAGTAGPKVIGPGPLLTVDDLGVHRGDGVFETIGVFGGRILELGPHLDRLARSMHMLDMPEPDLGVVENAVRLGIRELGEVPEAIAKLVVTRGIESGDGTPTAWALVSPSPVLYQELRRGIDVVTLDRGYRTDVARTAPWLLQGAKTTSYALNMAALREAERRGAREVVFVSTDGYVLEGPTSSVIVRRGDEFATTPHDAGILAGTTQAALWRILGARGHRTAERLMTVEDLVAADSLWQISSGKLLLPIRSLDGAARAVDQDLTDDLNAALKAEAR